MVSVFSSTRKLKFLTGSCLVLLGSVGLVGFELGFNVVWVLGGAFAQLRKAGFCLVGSEHVDLIETAEGLGTSKILVRIR